jgi:catechol 2,3-dioxygenase-like lactoylglutathione lyase family enzyme
MLKSAPFYATVPVSDIARARRFYEETLELGPATPVGPALRFECGRGTSCLMVKSEAAGRGACAFWQVDDVEAVVEWLRGRGVAFDRVDAASAWFRDSEGNRMALMLLPGAVKPRREARAPVVAREEQAAAALAA